jgi:hydrogenase-1 operon protein HyaF
MTGRPIDIPIRAESGGEPVSHGNALPLLHEVRHALERLLAAGEETVIDLRSIPMGPGDEARLEAELGTGDVSARLETAIGPSSSPTTTARTRSCPASSR